MFVVPSTLSTDRLQEEIVGLASRIAALTCHWLELVAELDRRGAHEPEGFYSCSGWLAWRCSIAPRAAREHVRVARALGERPLVHKAFSRGELSYSKVRAITRVEDPALEEHLVEMARHASAAQLERVVRGLRKAVSLESELNAHARRHLWFDWEEDGALSFGGRLSPEEGALLLRALELGRDVLNEAAQSGPAEPPAEHSQPSRPSQPASQASPARNVDALVAMAESLLANGASARPGGERHQVVVHVDAEVLASGGDDHTGRCEIEHGPVICAETARRLACDASVVGIIEGPHGTLDIGRRTRTIPSALRRALRNRDRVCRFPACNNHRWLDGHHIRHWSAGGETKLDNLVQLCRRHHRLLHEHGFGLERLADGSLLFRRPDGSVMPASPAMPPVLPMPMRSAERPTLHRTAVRIPPPSGDPLDLDLAVSGLLARAGPAP